MPELSMEQQAYLMKLVHYEKKMPGLGVEAVAGLFGVDAETYRRTRNAFADRARAVAADLLRDAAFAACVDELPFAPGDVVVGLGDSITDDDESWFEILRHLVDFRRQEERICFVNAGISGDTTMEMLSRFPSVAAQNPAWILCLAGTNDACRVGANPVKSLISLEETVKNLEALRQSARGETCARWLWITPPPVLEEMARNHWMAKLFGCWWRDDDIAAIADAIRTFPDSVVDIRTLFGDPVEQALLLVDGLHPSITGQKGIVRAVVERLSSLEQGEQAVVS